MDYTSHTAAVAIALGATCGLVGLFTFPALAIRQSRRDAVVVERAWVEIRAERRAAALAAAAAADESLADAESVVTAATPVEPAQPAVAEAQQKLIGAQRREPVAH